MLFTSFIQKLIPSFGKGKVAESYQVTIAGIKNHTLPAYEAAAELFNGQKFTSKFNKDLEDEFKKVIGGKGKKGIIEGTRDALKNSLLILEIAEKLSQEIYNENEANISLDFQKATLLRIVQASEFASDYARKLLNAIYVNEAAERGIGANMVPAQVKYIQKNFNDFLTAIEFMFTDSAKFEAKFKEIPQAIISDISEKTLAQTTGVQKLDPFTLRGFVGMSPIYMFIAQRQAEKYKETKEQYELLQLRMLQLKKLQEKQADASLEKQINYMQDRLTTLEFKIEKMNKEYGID